MLGKRAACALVGACLAAWALAADEKEAKKDDFGLWAPRNVRAGDWTLNFSGELRAREEWWNNADLNRRADDRDARLFFRTRLKAEAIYRDACRFVVELADGREWESDRDPRPQNNEFDLHQAYLDLNLEDTLGAPLGLRIGRQERDIGSRRLVGAPSWGNLLRAFDAIRLTYTPEPIDLCVFYGANVVAEDDHFDRARPGERFYGVFATVKLLDPQKMDLYAFRLDNRNDTFAAEDGRLGEHHRQTYGARLYGPLAERWTYDLELAHQRGRLSHDPIRAWAFHADTVYTFDAPWKPTVQLLCHYATGDSDPADGRRETFDPLFTSTHQMYGGIMDLVTWMNIKVVGARFRMNPVQKLTLTLEAHRFWLEEAEDAWYSIGKAAVRRDATGRAGNSLGAELGVIANYAVNRQLEFEAGLARFLPGSFVGGTGPSAPMDFAYLQTIFRF